MPDVTSWFIDQASSKYPTNLVRKFYIGTSDYSSRVISWPSVDRDWDMARAASVTVDLANQDGAFNFLRANKHQLRDRDYVLKFGFTHPQSGDELLEIYRGTVDELRYVAGTVSLNILDGLRSLSERVIGSAETPTELISYYPSELAWFALTSYGGMSDDATTANTQIDVEAFSTWGQIFADNAVHMTARLSGVKSAELLQKLARLTYSAIYHDGQRVTFSRFAFVSSLTSTLDDSVLYEFEGGVYDGDTVNEMQVGARYDVDSDWLVTVVQTNTVAVGSYGLRQEDDHDQDLHYVDSVSAIDYAQRVVLTLGYPPERAEALVPLVGLTYNIGDTVYVVDSAAGYDADPFRYVGVEVDMQSASVRLKLDKSVLGGGGGGGVGGAAFTLDVSSLDGADLLA